ncbi:MAG: hypothetical protein Q8O89_08240 [Nanoarchaeota archaeon]|nr:hypothetical protein [Nanoarchaeota archaeon]
MPVNVKQLQAGINSAARMEQREIGDVRRIIGDLVKAKNLENKLLILKDMLSSYVSSKNVSTLRITNDRWIGHVNDFLADVYAERKLIADGKFIDKKNINQDALLFRTDSDFEEKFKQLLREPASDIRGGMKLINQDLGQITQLKGEEKKIAYIASQIFRMLTVLDGKLADMQLHLNALKNRLESVKRSKDDVLRTQWPQTLNDLKRRIGELVILHNEIEHIYIEANKLAALELTQTTNCARRIRNLKIA